MTGSPTSSVGDYDLYESLGEGTFAKVYRSVRRSTGEEVAVKSVSKAVFRQRPRAEEQVRREIAITRILDHPNILRFIDAMESDNHLYLVVELASRGELFDFLVENHKLPLPIALPIFREIIAGVDYLHSRDLCHRDLKPENVLLDKFGHPKIADFGFARWIRGSLLETSCGSPHYAAPEIVDGQSYDGRLADVWSCGVILFALLSGRLPFDVPDMRQLLRLVRKGQFKMPSDFPGPIKELIRGMMTKDVRQRMTMAQVKEHAGLRLDIPGLNYRMSASVPIPPMHDPIDADRIETAIVRDLVQLGFDDECEVRDQLQQAGDNNAKVFYHMMSIKGIGARAYPWSSMDDLPASPAEFFEVPGRGEGDAAVAPIAGGLEGAAEVGSPVATIVWESVGGADEGPSAIASTIENISLKVEEAMSRLQALFTGEGYKQFHPTPVEIVAGDVATDRYVIVKARFTSTDAIGISVEHIPGDQIGLSDWMRKIGQVLAGPSILTGATP
jgi:BR serine/threonine kinase